MVSQEKSAVPAHVPFKTIEGVVTATLEQGLPQRLDRSVFPTLSGSVQSGVLRAFEFLGFTDGDGVVQPPLRRWIDEPDARPSILGEIIREKYAPVMALADSNGTPAQMREEIEKMGVSGTTSQKAVRFYLAASDFAGLQVPATWKKARVGVGGGRRRRRRTREAETSDEPEPSRGAQTDPANTVDLGTAGSVTLRTEIDPMALAAEDREWLFGLIDHFRSYEPHGGDEEDTASEVDDDDA